MIEFDMALKMIEIRNYIKRSVEKASNTMKPDRLELHKWEVISCLREGANSR